MNAYAPISDSASVMLLSSVLFPTLGNPSSTTVPSPVFLTAKPSPPPPPLLLASFSFSLASCALYRPIAFCVLLLY